MRENIVPKEALEGIKDAASTLIEDVEKFSKATRDAASDTLGYAQKNVKKNISQLYGKGQERLHEVENYVQKHPTRVLLIAAAAGFALGFLRKKVR